MAKLRWKWSTTSAELRARRTKKSAAKSAALCMGFNQRKDSALTALALIAATMHASDAEIGMRIDMRGAHIVEIMNRSTEVIEMSGMGVRSGPARPLACPLVLGFKQCTDLLGGLLGCDRLRDRTTCISGR